MKIGDVVRVLKGDVLERVGYEETLNSAKVKMRDDLLMSNHKSTYETLRSNFQFLSHKDVADVEDILARAYNKNVLKFGGNERKIFTKYMSELDGEFAKIVNRLVRQTGTYNVGGGYGDDYEPSFLGNQKSHVFFELAFMNKGVWEVDWSAKITPQNKHPYSIWIEKSNLEFLYTP